MTLLALCETICLVTFSFHFSQLLLHTVCSRLVLAQVRDRLLAIRHLRLESRLLEVQVGDLVLGSLAIRFRLSRLLAQCTYQTAKSVHNFLIALRVRTLLQILFMLVLVLLEVILRKSSLLLERLFVLLKLALKLGKLSFSAHSLRCSFSLLLNCERTFLGGLLKCASCVVELTLEVLDLAIADRHLILHCFQVQLDGIEIALRDCVVEVAPQNSSFVEQLVVVRPQLRYLRFVLLDEFF